MSSVKMAYEGDLRVVGDFTTDVSQKWGGLGEHPTPTDLFTASLGSCILSLMALKARAMGFDMTGTTIEVEKVMTATDRFEKLVVTVDCSRAIDAKSAAKLERAARGCPVHDAIDPSIKQELIFKWNLSS